MDQVSSAQPKLIQSVLGVHCACYDMCSVPEDPFCVDIPISAHIARWNINTKQRINTFDLHDAVIASIQRYNDPSSTQYLTATCGYDGMLKIWDKDYHLLCEAVAHKHYPAARIDWSKDGKQLIVHIKTNESTYNDCIISLYNLNYNDKDDTHSLELCVSSRDNYRYAVFNKYNQILAFNTDPNVIELLSKNDMKFIGAFTYAVNKIWTVAISINADGTKLAMATTTKEILIVDALTLKLLNVIKHKELSPNLWTVIWNKYHQNEIIFSPKNGWIEIWDAIKGEMQYKCVAPPDFVYVLEQIRLDSDDFIFVASSDSVFMQRITRRTQQENEEGKQNESAVKLYNETINKSRMTLQYHSITCCGVDLSFNSDGKCEYIAVGDLGCSLCVWSADQNTKYNDYKPLVAKACVMSIRSLKWIPHTNIIFVGCLDGSLCLYRFIDTDINSNNASNSELLPVIFSCNAGITCIEYKYQYKSTCDQYVTTNNDDIIISVGTNGGEIFIFKFDDKHNKLKMLNKFRAHPPVQSDDVEYKKQFGSIHKAADIWTCVWSPNGRYLASASEDQSTKIWDANDTFKYVTTLRGHTAAVTCVDWTYLNNERNEIFATCADDRRIMIWKPKQDETSGLKWDLLNVFSPQNVLGWFTFTYLRFERDGLLLSAGTENGYVCIFDINEMKEIYTKCLHRGSIEGLECNKNGLSVSVASDCTIVIQQIHNVLNTKKEQKSLL